MRVAAAIAFVSSVVLATPSVACSGLAMPTMRRPPKTADSKKPKPADTDPPKAVPSAKGREQKPATPATPKDPATKPDKVSRK